MSTRAYEMTLIANAEEVEDLVAEVTEIHVSFDDSTPLSITARKLDDVDGSQGRFTWFTLEQAKQIRDFLNFTLPK